MRILWWIVGTLVVVILGVGTYFYYDYREHHPWTDNAYVQANVVNVAPRVSGQVIQTPAQDQQLVQQDQLLFAIDPVPYRLQVEQAAANLDQTAQMVNAAKAAVAAAEAEVKAQQVQYDNAHLHAERTLRLAMSNFVSQSAADDSQSALKGAQASVNLAQARLQQARQQLGTPGDNNERIRQARAALHQAQLNLSYTEIKSPCFGRLSGYKVQPGQQVQMGQPLFALVCEDKFWVYANFKETQMDRIRPGQQATIKVDMYPGQEFHGVVQNIDPASGTAFSLLPPQNATGNWVKVTQRVPVRILVTDPKREYPLRVQTSGEVTIDTGTGKEPIGYTFWHTDPQITQPSDQPAPSQASAIGGKQATPGPAATTP